MLALLLPTNEALRQRNQNCIRAKKGKLTADFEFPGMKRNQQICGVLRPVLSLDLAKLSLRLQLWCVCTNEAWVGGLGELQSHLYLFFGGKKKPCVVQFGFGNRITT